MLRLRFAVFALAALLLLTVTLPASSGGDPPASPKEALQAFNDYIGKWKGSGTSEKSKTEIWKENFNWSWRFKGDDTWLALEIGNGKYYKAGELRYLPKKERYELTMIDKADKKHVFEGELKKAKLLAERLDPDSKDVQQVQMNLAGDGVRLIYTYSIKPANRTLFTKEWQVALTREGESFGSTKKKEECIVTGGLGTMAVAFKGVTYFVCCSGCRDAFNENPAKFVAEREAKRKKQP